MNYQFLVILCLLLVCSEGCKHKVFTENNFADEKWIAPLLPKEVPKENFTDTSTLDIRISSKNVMTGFLKSTNLDSRGAFGQIIEMFDGFRSSPHNPYVKVQYQFFNGDNPYDGEIIKTVSNKSDLWDEKNYSAKTNNLNYQFRNIANEISSNYDKRRFYAIISDGEFTIRKYKNDNRSKLSDVQNAVKDILIKQPNVCIGVVSLLAVFNGNYTYEPDSVRKVNCQRYLYAFCFFDKSFIREFEEFSEYAYSHNGNAFVFNPKLSDSYISSSYVIYPEKLGVVNKSKSDSNRFAAYIFHKNLADSVIIKNKVNGSDNLRLPTLSYKIYYYQPIDKYVLDKTPKEIESHRCQVNSTSNFAASLHLGKSSGSGIYKVEYTPDYDSEISQIAGFDISKQDIDNNTLEEIESLKSPDDILKTEGLKDLYQEILSALKDVQQPAFYTTFVSIKK